MVKRSISPYGDPHKSQLAGRSIVYSLTGKQLCGYSVSMKLDALAGKQLCGYSISMKLDALTGKKMSYSSAGTDLQLGVFGRLTCS